MERPAPDYKQGAGAAVRFGVKRKASDGLPAIMILPTSPRSTLEFPFSIASE
jgi:hypothetical protein